MKPTPFLRKLLQTALFSGSALAAFTPAAAYTLYFDKSSSGTMTVNTVANGKVVPETETFDLTKVRVWVFQNTDQYNAMIKTINKNDKIADSVVDGLYDVVNVTAAGVGGLVGGMIAVGLSVPTAGAASIATPVLVATGAALTGTISTVATSFIAAHVDPAKVLARNADHNSEHKYTLNYGDVQPAGWITKDLNEKDTTVYIVITAHGKKAVPLISFAMNNTETAVFSVNKDSSGQLVIGVKGYAGTALFQGSYTQQAWKQLTDAERKKVKQGEKDFANTYTNPAAP